jgi:hypothetical protein
VDIFEFRLIDTANGGKMIQYRVKRDNRATSQVRRWMKKAKV